MSLAGHNRGKKYIAGVGYVFPKEKPTPKRKCNCGKPWRFACAKGVFCEDCLEKLPPPGTK